MPSWKEQMKKSRHTSYPNSFTILNRNGDWAFQPVACKEEFFHAISRNVEWKTHKRVFGCNGPDLTGRIDKENPTIIFYGFKSDDDRRTKTRDQAKRIKSVLDALSERMKLSKAEVRLMPYGNAISIEPDPFYLKSPVGISGLMTFIRHAANTKYAFKNITDFVNKAIDGENRLDSWGYTGMVDAGAGDGEHFRSAKKNGTLIRFLNKTLKCFKRRGFSSYRYAPSAYSTDEFFLDGFAEYRPEEAGYSHHTMSSFEKEW